MALRATQAAPSVAYNTVLSQAFGLRRVIREAAQNWAGGSVNVDRIYLMHWDIRNRVIEIERMLTVPNLAVYAARQDPDPAYHFMAEANALVTISRTAMATIRSIVPDRGGEVIAPDGESVQFAQLSGPDLATVRNALQSIDAAIT